MDLFTVFTFAYSFVTLRVHVPYVRDLICPIHWLYSTVNIECGVRASKRSGPGNNDASVAITRPSHGHLPLTSSCEPYALYGLRAYIHVPCHPVGMAAGSCSVLLNACTPSSASRSQFRYQDLRSIEKHAISFQTFPSMIRFY